MSRMDRIAARVPTMDPRRRDALIAAVLALLGVLESLAANEALLGDPGWGSTDESLAARAGAAAAALLIAVPLAWRRRYPIACAAAGVAGILIGDAWLHVYDQVTFAFFGLLLAVYSVAAHVEGRRAWLVLAGVAAAAVLDIRLAESYKSSADLFWGTVFSVALPAAIGRILRNRRLLARELAAKAERLEREREERAAAAVAQERTRIAGELHDVVAHSLTEMVVQASAARRLVHTDRERARETLGSIEATGREALTEMRRMLGVLRRGDEDLALAPQPSLARISDLIARARATGMRVELRSDGGARPLTPGIELTAYRIVEHALHDAAAHAPGGSARVVVRWSERDLVIAIDDDRSGGIDGEALGALRERVRIYGGELHAARRRGGCSLRARLPLPERVAA